MNRKITQLTGVILIVISALSCVSGKKYGSLSDTSKQYMNERDAFKEDNIGLQMKNTELEFKLASLEKETDGIRKEYSKVESERDKALGDYNNMTSRYNELQNAQEDLIKGNVRETQKLLEELRAAQNNLQNKEDLLKQLSVKLTKEFGSGFDESNLRYIRQFYVESSSR